MQSPGGMQSIHDRPIAESHTTSSLERWVDQEDPPTDPHVQPHYRKHPQSRKPQVQLGVHAAEIESKGAVVMQSSLWRTSANVGRKEIA